MWEIIKDKLFWSLIILLISSVISYFISRKMLKKNLRSNLYIDELKEIKSLLKISLDTATTREPIFMNLREYGWTDAINFENKVNNLSLNDKKLKNLLQEYLKLAKEYNNSYFEWNKLNLNEYGEPIRDAKMEERDRVLMKYEELFNDLFKKINLRIERIIT